MFFLAGTKKHSGRRRVLHLAARSALCSLYINFLYNNFMHAHTTYQITMYTEKVKKNVVHPFKAFGASFAAFTS
jgi:hypothetical protein